MTVSLASLKSSSDELKPMAVKTFDGLMPKEFKSSNRTVEEKPPFGRHTLASSIGRLLPKVMHKIFVIVMELSITTFKLTKSMPVLVKI